MKKRLARHVTFGLKCWFLQLQKNLFFIHSKILQDGNVKSRYHKLIADSFVQVSISFFFYI